MKELKWNWFKLLTIKKFWIDIGKNALELLPTLITVLLDVMVICFMNKMENHNGSKYAILALISSAIISLLISSWSTYKKGKNSFKFMIALLITIFSVVVYIFCTFKKYILLSDEFFDLFVYMIIVLSIFQIIYSLLANIEFNEIKKSYLKNKKSEYNLKKPNSNSKYKI